MWASHIIITADSFEDAIEKAKVLCYEMNEKCDGHTYDVTGSGYRLTVGGGCKW